MSTSSKFAASTKIAASTNISASTKIAASITSVCIIHNLYIIVSASVILCISLRPELFYHTFYQSSGPKMATSIKLAASTRIAVGT